MNRRMSFGSRGGTYGSVDPFAHCGAPVTTATTFTPRSGAAAVSSSRSRARRASSGPVRGLDLIPADERAHPCRSERAHRVEWLGRGLTDGVDPTSAARDARRRDATQAVSNDTTMAASVQRREDLHPFIVRSGRSSLISCGQRSAGRAKAVRRRAAPAGSRRAGARAGRRPRLPPRNSSISARSQAATRRGAVGARQGVGVARPGRPVVGSSRAACSAGRDLSADVTGELEDEREVEQPLDARSRGGAPARGVLRGVAVQEPQRRRPLAPTRPASCGAARARVGGLRGSVDGAHVLVDARGETVRRPGGGLDARPVANGARGGGEVARLPEGEGHQRAGPRVAGVGVARVDQALGGEREVAFGHRVLRGGQEALHALGAGVGLGEVHELQRARRHRATPTGSVRAPTAGRRRRRR